MRIFLHGLESSNQGIKAVYFRERFPEMVIPNFQGDLPERMEKLNLILKGISGITLVGSSFGGLMSSIFAMEGEDRVDSLILLAPALNLIGLSGYKAKEISCPVCIYHGSSDDVIPIKPVKDFAEKYFSNLIFNIVDDDHFLHNTFKTIDWAMLLGGGEARCSNKES